MSKRRIEQDIEEVSAELLEDLSPDERTQLVLQAQAAGKDQWVERLCETCPRFEFVGLDRTYTNRIRIATLLAWRAVYDLHTYALYYELASQRNRYRFLLSQTDYDVGSDGLDDEVSPMEWLTLLAVDHQAYERFATDILGASLAEWLSLSGEGDAVVEAVEELLEERGHMLEHDYGDFLDDPVTTDLTIEELADVVFEAVKAAWDEAIN